LNAENQKNLGRKEQLLSQRNQAIEMYKTTYGVELTPETVQAELERVSAVKEAEYAKLNQALDLIAENKYDEASKLMVDIDYNKGTEEKVEVKQEPVATVASAAPIQPTIKPAVQEEVAPSAPTVEVPKVAIPSAFAQSAFAAPKQPVQTQAKPKAQVQVDDDDMPIPAAPNPDALANAPQNNGTSAKVVIESFNDMLEGTKFQS
jgi:hypothetical protein